MPSTFKTYVKNYFSVTKKEWNGMLILLALLILALAAPYVYAWQHKDKTIDVKQLNEAIAKLNAAKANASDDDEGDSPAHKVNLFKFNPNHLPAEQWRQLGLDSYQVAVIQHYEAKGGQFRRKEDVQKIYSIKPEDYKRIAPYINLPGGDSTKREPLIVVEINTADSADLTQLRGIGPAFAMRIIHYRNRLGGFLKKTQLKEVFGIDDGKYDELRPQFTVNSRKVKKIDINSVDFEGLKNNPYLNFKQANAIIMYRKEHGNYESVAEMKNIAILDAGILRKIAPYLVFK